MNSALSVPPSIFNIVFTKLAHYFFLIFCMNIGFNKHEKREGSRFVSLYFSEIVPDYMQ